MFFSKQVRKKDIFYKLSSIIISCNKKPSNHYVEETALTDNSRPCKKPYGGKKDRPEYQENATKPKETPL